MPTLRFANPELHAQFLEGLKALPFAIHQSDDGSVSCTEEQWAIVNAVAHRVRDGCFKWYFTSRHTPEDAEAFEHYMRARGLRYELEHHEDGPVFLLPKADRGKHTDMGMPEACSFCEASFPDRQRFFGTYVVAICDECVREFHADLESDTPNAGDA
jgi:hypothetical protein